MISNADFGRAMIRALRRARKTGRPVCLIADHGQIRLQDEDRLTAADQAIIDRILWSSNFSDADGIDPRLLA